MKRLALTVALFAFAAVPALAFGELPSALWPQPDAPVRVVGCSAFVHTLRNGTNVREQGSFEIVGSKTATAVRIGWAYFDALGGRHVSGAVTTGKFSPGARIDVHPFAGRVGSETKSVTCFAIEAAFEDGTHWRASAREFPRADEAPAVPAPPLASPTAQP